MATPTTPTVEQWTGQSLPAATYLQFQQRVVELTTAADLDNATLEATLAALRPLLTRLQRLVRQEGAYTDTPAVQKADQWRDRLVMMIIDMVEHASKLPAESQLGVAGARLWPQVKPYKKIQKHELSQETSEVTGLLRVLATTQGAADAQTLGLTQAVTELGTENRLLAQLMAQREAEEVQRREEKSYDTVTELRPQIAEQYHNLVIMVNALSLMGTEAAQTLVLQLNATIDHYQQIDANRNKNKGDEPEPEPTPEPEPEPDDQGGGDDVTPVTPVG